ncbi:MAG TPA: metal ABC transporter ATP-binding protein [Patescibacteria group bacterium]|nr:metal ABC transporter ATP-binding protein [Patescibacteria group bacterium]
MTPIVELNDLTITYERHPAIHHLRGGFSKGSLTAVIGPNGAGKSTLIKAIVGLLAPSAGRLAIHGISPRDIAYLPQMAVIDDSFPISVFDVVLLGHWRRVGAFRAMTAQMCETAQRALWTVGLEGFDDRPFGSLSAGQRQRVLFARVLVADSPLIVLDEPFTAVDTRTTNDLLRLVARWHGEGRTVISVLHDFDQVRRHFPDTLLLAREAIGWGPTAEVLTSENLLKARAMSEAWDIDAEICRGAA